MPNTVQQNSGMVERRTDIKNLGTKRNTGKPFTNEKRGTTSIQQKERPVKILGTAVYDQRLAVPTLPDRAGVSRMGTTLTGRHRAMTFL